MSEVFPWDKIPTPTPRCGRTSTRGQHGMPRELAPRRTAHGRGRDRGRPAQAVSPRDRGGASRSCGAALRLAPLPVAGPGATTAPLDGPAPPIRRRADGPLWEPETWPATTNPTCMTRPPASGCPPVRPRRRRATRRPGRLRQPARGRRYGDADPRTSRSRHRHHPEAGHVRDPARSASRTTPRRSTAATTRSWAWCCAPNSCASGRAFRHANRVAGAEDAMAAGLPTPGLVLRQVGGRRPLPSPPSRGSGRHRPVVSGETAMLLPLLGLRFGAFLKLSPVPAMPSPPMGCILARPVANAGIPRFGKGRAARRVAVPAGSGGPVDRRPEGFRHLPDLVPRHDERPARGR